MPVDPLTPYAEIDVRMPGLAGADDVDSADPFAVRPMSPQMWNLFHPQPVVAGEMVESSSGSGSGSSGESYTRIAPGGGAVYGVPVPLDLSPLPNSTPPGSQMDPSAVAAWLDDQEKAYRRSLVKTVQERSENLRPGLGGKPEKRLGGVLGPLQALRDKLMPGVPDASDAIDWYKKHAAKDPNAPDDPNAAALPPVTSAMIGLPSEVRREDGSLVGPQGPVAVQAGAGVPTANDYAGVPAQRPKPKYWTDNPDGFGERVAHIAQQMIGQPVRYGQGDWMGADAPGLVRMAYENAGVPRGQMGRLGPEIVAQGDRVKLKDLRPGDIVAVDRRSVAGRGVDHVAIYAGNGEVVEAPDRTDLPIRRRALADLADDGRVMGVRLRQSAEEASVSLADNSAADTQARTEAERRRQEAQRRRREAARKRREAQRKRQQAQRRRRRSSSSGGSSSGSSKRYYGSTSRTSGNSSKKYSGIGATK